MFDYRFHRKFVFLNPIKSEKICSSQGLPPHNNVSLFSHYYRATELSTRIGAMADGLHGTNQNIEPN